MKNIPDYMKKIKGDPSFYYNQPKHIIDDKRFATCVQYANFISKFFEEHDIANWELAGVKARFSDDLIPEQIADTISAFEKKAAENVMNFDWSKPMVAREDKINPDHYKVGGIETFDILRAKLSPTQLAGFCKGNVLKYITRADHKDKVDDLKKCRWYLDKLIEELDGKATS